MSATVRIPTILRSYTGGANEVTVDGGTLAEVLDALESNHPGIRARVLDDAGWEHPDVLRWQPDSGAGPSGALANEVAHFVGAASGAFPCEVPVADALHAVEVR